MHFRQVKRRDDLAEMSPASTSCWPKWLESALSCCSNWCLRPSRSLTSAIRPTPFLPRAKGKSCRRVGYAEGTVERFAGDADGLRSLLSATPKVRSSALPAMPYSSLCFLQAIMSAFASLPGQRPTAGCAKVYAEKVSGTRSDRAELEKQLRRLGEGDVLMVIRLDRMRGCSTP
jgi:hypothetical protein